MWGPRRDRSTGLRPFGQAGFDASWELDLFGGARRQVEAAGADLAAAEENARDVLVTLTAEVARSYLELRGAQKQLAIARRNLRAQADTAQLTRTRFQAGVAGELDVVRAEGQVAATEAQIPLLEAAAEREIHRLRGELERAHEASALPMQPIAAKELHDLLVRIRLREIQQPR